MLEKMDSFFEARLDGYEEHMLNNIESAQEFYPFTAKRLPQEPGSRVLDLGCGTGLELNFYFAENPNASVVGIDLSKGMLEVLSDKFRDRDVTLICGNYFEVPLGESEFDAAVSVESLHHFTQEEKIALYIKVYEALKSGAKFVLTDYFARSEQEACEFREELLRLKKAQDITDDEFYHFDTPLTVEYEIQALLRAGFSEVRCLNNWGATHTLEAIK